MQWFNRKSAVLILLVIVIITLVLGKAPTKSSFDYDFEKFFPPSDTETEYYEQFRNDFENDYDFLFIGLQSSKGITTPVFYKK